MIKRIRIAGAALLALGALALGTSAASAASSQVPFKATFSGRAEILDPTTSGFTGAGTATHMGRIATEGRAYISGLNSSCPGGVANLNVETLTAASGDTLTISSQDVACPTGPGLYHGTGQWTVTGGTGRFSGATGQGTYDGSADFNAGTFTIDLTGGLASGPAA